MLRLLCFIAFTLRFVIASARIRANRIFSAEELLSRCCLWRLLLSVKSLVVLSKLCPALLA